MRTYSDLRVLIDINNRGKEMQYPKLEFKNTSTTDKNSALLVANYQDVNKEFCSHLLGKLIRINNTIFLERNNGERIKLEYLEDINDNVEINQSLEV